MKLTGKLERDLDGMAAAACRAMVVIAYYDLQTLFAAEDTALRHPGVSWATIYGHFPSSQLARTKLQGWLGFDLIVDRKDALFKRMASGFDKHWLREYAGEGPRSVNSSVPTVYSAASWNAVIAVANVLTSMVHIFAVCACVCCATSRSCMCSLLQRPPTPRAIPTISSFLSFS